jgi:hypothetical protein
MSDEKQDKAAPAYIPWATFTNFINRLRETGMPTQINRSVITNLSYSTQAQLLAALRYLKLVDSSGAPQPTLSHLVEANETDRKDIIKRLLEERYPFVFTSLDLSRTTTEEIERQFRQVGITGSTVGRAVGFFLAAAESAGLTISPHVKKRTATSNGGSTAPRQRRSRQRKRTSSTTVTPTPSPTPPPAESNPLSMEGQLLGKFPTFDPAWPDELKKAWFEDFKDLMGMVNSAKPQRREPSSSQ